MYNENNQIRESNARKLMRLKHAYPEVFKAVKEAFHCYIKKPGKYAFVAKSINRIFILPDCGREYSLTE